MYTLATYSFPEQHTGDNIVEKLKEVVSKYDINDNSIFANVHDQGSNFQWAGHLLEDDKQWESVNCAVIEVIVNNCGLLKDSILILLHTLKRWSNTFIIVHKLLKSYKKESISQPKRKSINDCTTRWNSTFYMCQSLLENRWPISAVLADKSVTRVEHRRLEFTTTQWELLGDLVKILHSLEIGMHNICTCALKQHHLYHQFFLFFLELLRK